MNQGKIKAKQSRKIKIIESMKNLDEILWYMGFPGGSSGKESTWQCRRYKFDSWQEDLLEEEMAIYSSILAWEIPWTVEPGAL